MDTFPDLGSLSDQELKDLIQQLTEEEVDISYRRRILHGQIDILPAELVDRLRKRHEARPACLATAPSAASPTRKARTTASAAARSSARPSRPRLSRPRPPTA